ncbi:amino acid permease [Trypanosoma theileri]|uniref:Amino acid permease n=1 Tax=Trypanosoma theileri TaxID=67003 RepID=A0A1X0P4S1_9TRYP|nr:amino acid permease [Trypanosoma theileri]ORC91922.1 amino acid permease [Trypanosoma theileri]
MKHIFSRKGLLGAALSLSVTTIGAGILAIPSTLDDCGILLVVLLMIVVGIFTVISIDYLVICIETLQLRSYEEISGALLGRTFEEIARWMLIVYNVGVAAGYIVVIGEIFSPMMPIVSEYFTLLSNPTRVMVAIWMFVMLPLSCIPAVSSLRFVSILAITATFVVSGVIVYRYFFPIDIDSAPDNSSIKYISLSNRTILALPILMFSFDCQTLVFQIYASIADNSRKCMAKVATLSIFITGLIYGMVGLFGYLSHTSHVHGNILTNYDPIRDKIFAVGGVMYSITVITAYVLVLFPCRDAIFILLYGYSNASRESFHALISFKDNMIASIILSVLSVLLALKAPGLVFIIALLGGLCSSTLCFIYPAAFRLRMHTLGICTASNQELFMAFAMLSLGFISAAMGTAVGISGIS